MNPLTNMKNVLKLSKQELDTNSKSSWHDEYRDSAWIFIGGLPFDLSEGDIICIFSQYGEVVNINLIRAKETGKSRGFCFLCYEDQRSTILAVDNLNGIKILNRTIRVDHVAAYKVPKEGKKTDEETKKLYEEGCAPKPVPIIPKVKTPPRDFRETIADQIQADIKLPPRLPIYLLKQDKVEEVMMEVKTKKEKKDKKKRKKEKYLRKSDSSDSSSESNSDEDVKEKNAKRKKKEGKKIKDKKQSKSHKDKKHSKEKPSGSRHKNASER